MTSHCPFWLLINPALPPNCSELERKDSESQLEIVLAQLQQLQDQLTEQQLSNEEQQRQIEQQQIRNEEQQRQIQEFMKISRARQSDAAAGAG